MALAPPGRGIAERPRRRLRTEYDDENENESFAVVVVPRRRDEICQKEFIVSRRVPSINQFIITHRIK